MAMDPVSQVLAQQESGSAGGQGFGQFYVEGQRQGLSRKRLELEERQEKRMQTRDDLMLPLEQRAKYLELAILGQKAQMNVNELEATTQLNNALPEIYRLQSEFAQAPDGYANRAKIDETMAQAARYPRAYLPGTPGGNLLQNIQAVPILRQKFQQVIEYDQKLQGTGSRVESVDATGRINLGQRTSTMPANLQEAAAITAQRRRVEAATDPATRAALQTELDDMLMQTTPSGMSIETTTPDGTRTVVSTGRPKTSPEGLTTATQTDLQRRETAGLMSLQTLDRLKTVIANNPNAWGVRGSVGSIVETGQGILDPQAEAPVKKAINDADIAFTQLADSFKVDSGQMSNYERLKLEKAAGITGIGESQRSAQDKIANLEDAVVGRLLRVAKTQGKRVEDTVLRRIPESEIPSLGEEGLLTEEDALRWYRLKRATQQQAR